VTLRKYLIRGAAWLEILAGVALIMGPRLGCLLLFAAPLEGAGVPITRLAGVVLLALGTACLPRPPTAQSRGAALGLFVYNAGATILFVWVGLAAALHGILLWPAVILHAGIAAALLPQLLSPVSVATWSVKLWPDQPRPGAMSRMRWQWRYDKTLCIWAGRTAPDMLLLPMIAQVRKFAPPWVSSTLWRYGALNWTAACRRRVRTI